ncbi:hypothetical protein HPP92_001933 [Vanilla planifolia]|uniref:DNA polymerase delta subunit 4 n=1 Tax=Vanilla planifolia TaxID=51239 RepID=A0A835VFT7_VANPL|nr:hypothetical protein HPP92_001933 [Vanilla planifolia]
MASADIKGFFRQKKKGGVAKKSSSSAFSSKKNIGKGRVASAATLGAADPAQVPALIAHGKYDVQDDYGEYEEKLRQFDMDMKYGPCVGLTRLERWERADSMELNPPPEIRDVLLRFSGPNPALDCLWEGRV